MAVTPVSRVVIYPNPTNGILHIQHPETASSFLLMDITGRQIEQQQPDHLYTTTFDLSNLPDGVYWLQYQDHGHWQSEKIIKTGPGIQQH